MKIIYWEMFIFYKKKLIYKKLGKLGLGCAQTAKGLIINFRVNSQIRNSSPHKLPRHRTLITILLSKNKKREQRFIAHNIEIQKVVFIKMEPFRQFRTKRRNTTSAESLFDCKDERRRRTWIKMRHRFDYIGSEEWNTKLGFTGRAWAEHEHARNLEWAGS